VDAISRVARQPSVHLGYFVGAIVIHDQVDREAAREIDVDVMEKSQKLLMPVPSVAVADRHSTRHIQGRE
jgi:hypothetical protein